MIVIDKKYIAEILSKYISYFSVEELESFIEIPPDEFSYTYAFPCFRLTKFEKKAPMLIAEDLKDRIKLPESIEKLESEGPYLNFRVKSQILLQNIILLQEDYGRIREKVKPISKSNVVIEYPAPNTNKPLHFGHIRNMLLGKSLSNLLIYKGHKVFQVNLNNDRGIHICKSMIAYQKWGQNKEPDMKSDHFVGKYYVKYSQMLKKNPQLEKEARKLLRLWEDGDDETRDLWKKMNKWALDGFKITYDKLGIKFDKEYYESNLYLKGKEIINEGLENGLFEKTEDGAIFAPLKEKYNLEDKFLIRSDGTSIYITQDIYLAYLKKKDFNYDKSIYVVGDEQIQHFKWLFAILDLLGFKEDNFHLSYGMIDLPEGKMKSREGTVVDADDIISKVEKLAFEEVNKRYPSLSEEKKEYRAKIIGMAALKFYILKFSAIKGFTFNPKESISFEGETGPYILYCIARINSIISKSGRDIDLNVNYELLNHKAERSLILQRIPITFTLFLSIYYHYANLLIHFILLV
ncbi:MAG: arginine--tRNA ligase [Promethearchaeota archaeon]